MNRILGRAGLLAGFLIGVAAWGSISIAHAEDLWRGSKTGMTIAQVQAAFPLAHPPAKIEHLHGGASDDLVLDNVDLGSDKAEAHFYFEDGKLTQVTLEVAGLHEHMTRLNMDIARQLQGLLKQKYGEPLSCVDRQDGVMNTYDCTWLSNGTTISILYLDIGGKLPLLNIVYQVRLSDAARNL